MALSSKIKWGVNGHWFTYPAYGKDNTAEVLRLAQEMGCTIFRLNVNPKTAEDVAWVREVCRTCHDYGMEVMLALDNFGGTVDEVVARMTYAAEHLQNDADYFQIFNETDLWAARTDDGSARYNNSDPTGESVGYYNPNRVKIAVEKTGAALEVFHRVAPQAKLVINLAEYHYPMLDFYREAGLKWDIIGIDLYRSGDHGTPLRRMAERFPDCDLMIVECNYPSNADHPYYDETVQAEWLEKFMQNMSDYGVERLKAVIIYELLDQPSIQKDEKWNGEAHFGLVHVNPDNTIADPKPAYYAMQKQFKGK